MSDDGYVRETLGSLVNATQRIERDIADIKRNGRADAEYAQETRRRVDRNTTFARALAAGGSVLMVVGGAVLAFFKS